MIHIQNSQVAMLAVSTKAAVNMIVDDDVGLVKDADHRSNFCATIAYYFTSH
jgi:glucan 1,3-beta-glucosidase